jgi:hypothetical protein
MVGPLAKGLSLSGIAVSATQQIRNAIAATNFIPEVADRVAMCMNVISDASFNDRV